MHWMWSVCYYLQKGSLEPAETYKKNNPSQECDHVVSGHIERQSKQTKNDGKYAKATYGQATLAEATASLSISGFPEKQEFCTLDGMLLTKLPPHSWQWSFTSTRAAGKSGQDSWTKTSSHIRSGRFRKNHPGQWMDREAIGKVWKRQV